MSIGIPTYNRVGSLQRAVASALAQDYDNLEIVLSDNASTDATREFCEAVQARDARVRYVRQVTNLGAGGNFRAVLQCATGEFFMWLADDDWIDPGYVALCVNRLADSRYALVAGIPRYYRRGEVIGEGAPIDLRHDDRADRVAAYYESVTDNGVFYGLARRAHLLMHPVPATIGGDWLAVARLAFLGNVVTLEGVFLHRAAEGISDGLESLVRAYGLRGRRARNPYGLIARDAFVDILWKSPVYRSMNIVLRGRLACRAASAIVSRYYLLLLREERRQIGARIVSRVPFRSGLRQVRRLVREATRSRNVH